MSRIGRKPIQFSKEVKLSITNGTICVEGPKGKLNWKITPGISIELKDSQAMVGRSTDTKKDRAAQGLNRAMIVNMIKGVTQGYKKELEIIGVGFRAQIQGNTLNMQLGFSHPVNFTIPEGIKIETPKPTQIIITGSDKEKVGEIAAEIRDVYPPEPYKGKGIRFVGEHVRRKVGKAQATGK